MRVINLIGEVNESTAKDILEKVFEFELEDSKKIEAGNYDLEPVTFNISSDGGYVSNSCAIYDAISNLKCKIITRVWGHCNSSAINLFLLGNERLIGENSIIIWHPSYYSIELNVYKQRAYNDFQQKRQDKLDKIMLEKTKVTKEMLDQHKQSDWFILPEKAVELGIAHKII